MTNNNKYQLGYYYRLETSFYHDVLMAIRDIRYDLDYEKQI